MTVTTKGTNAQGQMVNNVAVFEKLGLREHLTPQRSNGFRSMVDRIRRDANAALATAS